jgi:hypothetical protein
MPAWLRPTGTANTTLGSTPTPEVSAAPYKPYLDRLRAMGEAERKSLAAALRAGRYAAPKNGAVGQKFVEALAQSEVEYEGWKAASGDTFSFSDFLTQRFNEDPDADKKGREPRTYTTTKISSDTAAAKTIQTVFEDLTGRTPSQKEIEKYTNMIRTAQKKNPTRTAVNADGTVQQTTGGIDEEQFLYDKLAKGDAAKKNRALDAYAFLNSFMGGGA